MSHEQILAMLNRQVAADGGAMSGGAMAGNFNPASARGLALYHQWRAQQPPMSRDELKMAWREHKAMSGGFVGEKAVRRLLKDSQSEALAAKRADTAARKQLAAQFAVHRDALRTQRLALKAENLRQYNRPGASTSDLHQALARLGVPEEVYSKTAVSVARPRRRKKGIQGALTVSGLMGDDDIEQYIAEQPDLDDPQAPLGLGLSGGRYYR